jgi:hypothetical protein
MAALKSKVNARIDQTNKHVAANAAQIKEDAKAARKALEKAVNIFDKKTANAREEAKKGRSKLGAQLAAQDKAIRQWANNKLKIVVASTAAHFRRVRAKMAADRAHADALLKTTTGRMTAALNTEKALRDAQFAKTVRDIAAAKAEAKARVAAASAEFKVGIRRLHATVDRQVAMVNGRIDQLGGVVQKNKLAQAKVNRNTAAEMKRMISLGNKRYKEHLKHDAELQHLINKNKAATDSRLDRMAAYYSAQLGKVRATMKKNRQHATHMLAKETGKLYAAIAKGEAEQHKTNGALSAQTRQATLDVRDALRAAKKDFGKRLGSLHSTVVRNNKKFEKKMDKLTGIVRANAVKSAKGRKMLASVMKANKEELKAAVSKAIARGEKRMAKAEAGLVAMHAKTKASMQMRITAQISKYAKQAASQIEGLRLSSKEARAEMKKEMLYAVRSAAALAKENLAAAAKNAKAKFAAASAKEATAAVKNAAARAALAGKIAADKKFAARALKDAVGGMTRSLLALQTETAKKIKKTNRRVDAFAARLGAQAKAVDAAMKANVATLTGKIDAARAAIKAATGAANAASMARAGAVLKELNGAMTAAKKASQAKFTKLYSKMSKNRASNDAALKGAIHNINNAIAKQAALADSRFSSTVKNIAAARAQASKQVAQARKAFATGIATMTASIKDQETRLAGEIQVVSGEVMSHKAAQIRVNRRTQAELKRIAKLTNSRHSASKRARGKLGAILNDNKRAAAEEVKALDGLFKARLAKIRHQAASNSLAAARDLSTASKKLYGKLASNQLQLAYANANNAKGVAAYSASSTKSIADAKAQMNGSLNQLTNVVAANHKHVEKRMEVLTGVIHNYNAAGKADRALLKKQIKAMGQDMNKRIVRAVQIGEAKARRVANRARVNLAKTKKALLIEISERVEATADKMFKSIQGNHKTIADNYLSFKAYAVTAGSKITQYVIKGKGKNLSSLGDLLVNTAALSAVTAGKAEGIGAGSSTLPSVFTGKNIKVHNVADKMNGLVNEYSQLCNGVRMRWPMGLGKYLLSKLELSMLKKGVLQVDKVDNHAGNFVFINGRAVGLSNKLNDFQSLAVRMNKYESTLAKLTAHLSGKGRKLNQKPFRANPPQWPGN